MGKIILKGYYGFGNFGDDILMVTTYWLLKDIFPSDQIIVCSENPGAQYIELLCEKSVPVVNSNSGLHADWIIHGGGGVFFDFNEGPPKYYWLNQLIKFIGYASFRETYNAIKRLTGNRGIEAKFRAGLGIGVGTYTPSSMKFYTDIVSLSDFDFLLVRDEESKAILERYKFKYPIHLGTDLAFLSRFWNRSSISSKSKDDTIGFVLRDWQYNDNAYLEVVLKVLLALQSQNRRLKVFSFDKKSDQFFIKKFSHHFPMTIWDPQQIKIEDYLSELSECSIVVTSRAHGAIVSACLGIPSLCLAIEPKLQKVHEMLKNCSRLIEPLDPNRIMAAVDEITTNQKTFQKAAALDVEHNADIMKQGMATFKKFISHISKA